MFNENPTTDLFHFKVGKTYRFTHNSGWKPRTITHVGVRPDGHGFFPCAYLIPGHEIEGVGFMHPTDWEEVPDKYTVEIRPPRKGEKYIVNVSYGVVPRFKVAQRDGRSDEVYPVIVSEGNK